MSSQNAQRTSRRYPLPLRCIAATVVIGFLAQDVACYAQQQARSDVSAPIQASAVHVPQDAGLIKEAQDSGSAHGIINIKDIHDNYSAQESIVTLLESLVPNYGVRTIGLEGTTGDIDVSILKAFPDEPIRRSGAGQLLKEGRLSAGEMFAALTEEDVAVYGVDDEPLYRANLEAFKRALKDKPANYERLRAVSEVVRQLEEKVFPPELLTLNRNSILRVNGTVRFTDRWRVVSELAASRGVGTEAYPQLNRLLEATRMEKGIDFKEVNREREKLMDLLGQRLLRQDLEALILESVSYRLGRVSQASFCTYMIDAADRAQVDIAPYVNLRRYAEYMAVFEGVDVDQLRDEAADFEDRVRDKLYRNDDERGLYRLKKHLEVLSDLFEVKLTTASLEYFKAHRKEYEAEGLDGLLRQLGQSYGVQVDPGLTTAELLAAAPEAMRFYELAEERNQALLANTVRKMREKGQTVACLVTGGFHSRGITELLKSSAVSYVVILPRFNKDSKRPYLTLLTHTESSYEEFARSESVLETKMRATAYLFAAAARRIVRAQSGKDPATVDRAVEAEIDRLKTEYAKAYARMRPDIPLEAPPPQPGLNKTVPVPGAGRVTGEVTQLALGDDYLATRSYLIGAPVVGQMRVFYLADQDKYVALFGDRHAVEVKFD